MTYMLSEKWKDIEVSRSRGFVDEMVSMRTPFTLEEWRWNEAITEVLDRSGPSYYHATPKARRRMEEKILAAAAKGRPYGERILVARTKLVLEDAKPPKGKYDDVFDSAFYVQGISRVKP